MRVLKNRNFAILLSGQLVSTIGNNLFSIALPWYVYALTNSKSALALTGVAETLPAVVGLVAGVWVDRWSKRATMITADLIRALLSVVLFVDVLSHWPLWTILLMVLALQMVGQFFNPASGALFPLLVNSEDIADGSGLLQSSNATAQLIGTVSGGALMGALGAPLLFLLDAISFLASVVSLFFIRVKETIVSRAPIPTPTPGAAGESAPSTGAKSTSPTNEPRTRGIGTSVHRFFQDWLEGWSLIRQSKFLVLIIAAALVANFALAPMDIALTAWVKGPMHGAPVDLGIINGGFFIGVILGGISVGVISRHMAMRQRFLIGLVALGACVASFNLFRGVAPEAALALLAGFCTGSFNGSLNAMFIQMIPEALRGRAFGILGGLAAFAMPLGMVIFGWLMVHMSLQMIFVLIGALCALSGASFLLPIKYDPHGLLAAPYSGISENATM